MESRGSACCCNTDKPGIKLNVAWIHMGIEPNFRAVIALRSLLSPVNCMWSVLPACCTTLTRLGFAAMSQSVVHRFTVSTDGLACLYGVPIREILFHCRVCGVPVLPPLTLNGLRPHSLGNRDAVDHYMGFPRSAIVLTPWCNSVLRKCVPSMFSKGRSSSQRIKFSA
jgi:hypothetical protein